MTCTHVEQGNIPVGDCDVDHVKNREEERCNVARVQAPYTLKDQH